MKAPRENNKQEKSKEIIIINDVLSPDLPIASYAARFRGNCLCLVLKPTYYFFVIVWLCVRHEACGWTHAA